MRTRRTHYLRAVNTCSGPSQIATIDVRNNAKGELAIYALFNRREGHKWTRGQHFEGNDPADFWEWCWSVGKLGRGLWLVSACWPRIAWPIELHEWSDGEIVSVRKASLTKHSFWVELVNEKRTIELVDLHNLWSKLPDGIDVVPCDAIDYKLSAKLTCERAHALITETISSAIELDLGIVQPTVGSWSLNLWRHWHIGKKLCIHTDCIATALEREAMTGGEVKVRRLGTFNGQWYAVDVNHLYAYAMSQYQLPYQLIGVRNSMDIRELNDMTASEGTIAKVRLKTDSYTYPVRKDGHTLYATGEFWTTLADPELRMALALGHIQEIGLTATYRTADLCQSWANRLWQLRQAVNGGSKSPLGKLLKYLAVSLHGRLGQHGTRWDAVSSSCPMAWANWMARTADGRWEWHRSIGDRSEVKRASADEPFDCFPAIAAWTTSAARVIMTEYRSIAGQDNCYYQYVDTLVTNYQGLENLQRAGLIDAKRIGLMRIDGSASQIQIRGLGWIRHDENIKASGIGPYAIVVDADTYEIIDHTSPAGIISPKGMQQYRVVSKVKHIEPAQVPGTVDADGWVSPPHLGMVE